MGAINCRSQRAAVAHTVHQRCSPLLPTSRSTFTAFSSYCTLLLGHVAVLQSQVGRRITKQARERHAEYLKTGDSKKLYKVLMALSMADNRNAAAPEDEEDGGDDDNDDNDVNALLVEELEESEELEEGEELEESEEESDDSEKHEEPE